jgi:hypothetical protein
MMAEQKFAEASRSEPDYDLLARWADVSQPMRNNPFENYCRELDRARARRAA